MLVVVLVGVNPVGGTCPVATVAISGGGASDQAVESPEVKASVGWGKPRSAPTREANKSTGCSESELQLSPEMGFPTRIGGWGRLEVPRLSVHVEGQRHRRRNWVHAADELPGVSGDDMPIEND
jgi:hypothetical protein